MERLSAQCVLMGYVENGRAAISSKRQTEPAALGKIVRDDLDWTVMKTLEKGSSEIRVRESQIEQVPASLLSSAFAVTVNANYTSGNCWTEKRHRYFLRRSLRYAFVG